MNNNHDIPVRLRRLRYHPTVRSLIRETKVTIEDLVLPIFVKSGFKIKNPISSMPGHFQYSVDMLEEEINTILDLGITTIIVFGIPELKDELGSDSYDQNGIVQQAVKKIKSIAPNLLVISDICLCQYTDHGHCGILKNHDNIYNVDNDLTLDILAKQAVSHAAAGADILAPAGMIDGMVAVIRKALDEAGFSNLPILSYSVKYKSAMYGPFGIAAEGAAKIGDRSTYQMDPANSNEAIREAMFDIEEGADMLMIKPAHTYLDIIYKVKENFPYIPVAAYQVSGEYSMLKAAFQNGWLKEKDTVFEVLTSIKRAGADFIISYFTKDVAKWCKSELNEK
ncbi:MAG: porphobilinogen synthase [Alphaproteobacteria bacterium]